MIEKAFSRDGLAAFLAEGLREALKRAPWASLAVSGGRTPEAVFPLLAQADLPWERVWITLTDERWVAPDQEGSTEGLVKRLLLKNKAASARFVGFWRPGLSPQAALPAIEHDLGRLPWPLNVAFLGMGPDGHIASLFPNDTALKAKEGRVAAARGPAPYPDRVTLTLPELARAQRVGLAAQGPEKQAVLKEGNPTLPIHRFLAICNESTVIFG